MAAAMQPDSFRVERSRELAASAEQIRPQLTDLERWAEWNPWADLDPNQQTTFSDPASGEGAWYRWEGNDDVGKGKMEIASVTDGAVRYHLEFIEPFASESEVEIQLEPQGERTRVVWIMSGDNDFMGKLFSLFMDMDESGDSKVDEDEFLKFFSLSVKRMDDDEFEQMIKDMLQ